MINDLATAGAMPALEQMLRFSAARQRLLAHNIANMDTPDFRPVDVSPGKFQQNLRKAVLERRAATGGEQGGLELEDTREVSVDGSGAMTLHPGTASGNILYHDRNNRDLERMMQDLAENGLAFRATADLMRRQNDLLRVAISQRV